MSEVTISIGEGEALALKQAYLLGLQDGRTGLTCEPDRIVSRVLNTLRKASESVGEAG